jgi:hypothetical protein
MEVVVLIPAILIFFYNLYKISGDDHVFIRKNISLEQIFDIGFIVMLMSFLFARFFFFIFHPVPNNNIFLSFFSTKGGLSLVGSFIGGMTSLYFIGKYNKLPMGRIFDFFTLAYLSALPLGFVGHSMLFRNQELIINLVIACIYFLFALFFMKVLYPNLIRRALKEGSIHIFFILLFSLLSLAILLVNMKKLSLVSFDLQAIVLLIIFSLSMFLLVKQEGFKFTSKKK